MSIRYYGFCVRWRKDERKIKVNAASNGIELTITVICLDYTYYDARHSTWMQCFLSIGCAYI